MIPNITTTFGLVCKKAQAIFPTAPLIIKGTQYPSQDVPEFMMIDLLAHTTVPHHRYTQCVKFTLQMVCYSLPGNMRTDGKFFRHLEMADAVKAAMDNLVIPVTNKNTCIELHECKITPLDLRSLGDFAKDIYANTPPLHLLSTVLILDGVIYGSDS
jgi:hypothetical protein